jgi:2'-5' RNA ligase
MSPKARLFFALAVDAPLRDALAALAADVAHRAGGRAVPAANLHATLAFLGSVARACVPALADVGAAAAHTATAVDVTLERLGSFRRARVAWIAPGDVPDALVALQRELAGALQRAGFALDGAPWRPHVTLARHCRMPLPPATRDPLAWQVRELVLHESVSAAGGVRYDALARWPLGGGASCAPRATGRDGSAIHSLHDPG